MEQTAPPARIGDEIVFVRAGSPVTGVVTGVHETVVNVRAAASYYVVGVEEITENHGHASAQHAWGEYEEGEYNRLRAEERMLYDQLRTRLDMGHDNALMTLYIRRGGTVD